MSTVTIPCPCPPRADGASRHPEDTITLREKLDFKAGMTARNAVQLARADDPDLSAADILTILTEIYILNGIEAWTLVDDKGKAIPVTRTAIRTSILSDQDRAMLVGDACDEAYAAAVMLPLLKMGSSSSPDTPTETSTSATNGSPVELRPRSKRSSTSTSPTGGTGPTSKSHAGAYS